MSPHQPRFDIITLFPEFLLPIAQVGVTGRAHLLNLWSMHTWQLRDFTSDARRTVDDRPFGGGPGMVMGIEPLVKAVTHIKASRQQAGRLSSRVVLLSPQGKRFDQTVAKEWSESDGLILLCGRYEGIDQRFIDLHVDDEVSLGDFVLSGGEVAAAAMIDASVRLLPGVLNDQLSAVQDSFSPDLSGLLDCPHYTRPEIYEGMGVPPVLLSGHHAKIGSWRREQALLATYKKRPDLIERARKQGLLSSKDESYLRTLTG